ncbi:MAG: FMN-binding protein, partial [Oscillospiraceae bacterium]|nr:FMN-binding protein [Oscillospiraceae bacterium]
MTKHRVTRRLLAVALSVLLVLGCVAPAVAATYESGTYTGTGTGRNGSVALTLTLTNGAIASVDNVTHSETARYWEKAKVLLDRLVGLQTPEQVEKLDAVTGATLSSNAIKEAAKDVFRQAESKETPVFASGSGTKSDPYLIRTAAQLQAFAAAVNGGTGYEGQYISLDADLDLTGTAWTPIGATGSFNGSFNGNYHTITGMTIGSESEKASYTEAGLFGSVGKGAAIRNVGVINAAIYNKTTTDPSVGLLAAGISENSIVESCWATGTIYSDTTSPYYSYVGGLVGSIGIKSLICNSWTNVVVYAKGSSDSFVGGIVGDTGNNSAVVNCAALGSVANYGNTSMMYGAGGVVGYSSGAVYASYSSSRIHMDAVSYDDGADVPVGGVVGSPSALSAAYNCYFNKEEKQTYYDGEVSTPLAVGYDVLNYSESDNDHCEGLTAAEIASETLLNKLTAALTPEELAKGQAYFKSESLLTGDITLDSLLSMTENGWCTWERNADGALLPTAGGSVTPEEPDYFAGGDGSVGDPYQIATEAQLRAFAEATQAGKLVTTNVCFALTADIALNGEWTPVHSFGGTFDGGDHTVSGMTIGTADAPSKLVSAGFFDVLANTARVHDLHLTNASVYVQRSGAALDDRIYAGGLVGGAGTAGSNVRIDNCSVTGSTIYAASGTFAYAGGLAGRLDRENVVTNCWTDIAVTAVSANSPACAGGLVATIGGSSMIANAAALGDVSVTGVSAEYNWCRAGGLLGSSAYLTHNCYASGNVSLQDSAESVKNVYLGCLIGEQSGGVVVSGHYFNGAVLRCNGETQTVKATGSIPASWYFDYNKITAHDSVTDAAFAAALNDGISESGLAETDAYLTSSGTFTSYTAEGLAAMRPAAWQSWGLADGKVVLGGSLDDAVFAGGDGSETAPFLIRTEAQLRAFAATTADGETYAGQYVALDADITLNGDWTPIHS